MNKSRDHGPETAADDQQNQPARLQQHLGHRNEPNITHPVAAEAVSGEVSGLSGAGGLILGPKFGSGDPRRGLWRLLALNSGPSSIAALPPCESSDVSEAPQV